MMDTIIPKLKIQFGKSTSQNYQTAVNRLKEYKNHSLMDKGSDFNSIVIEGKEISKFYRRLENLWYLVGGWKSTSIFLNETPINFYDLNKYRNIIDCNENYDNAINQEEHCYDYNDKEGWGCKFLQEINRYLPTGYFHRYGRDKFWYKYGKVKSASVWEIDKPKLEEALNKEAKARNLNFCSVFDFEKVKTIITELPDEIDIEKSEDWEFEYREIIDGTVIKKKPIGIRPKSEKSSEIKRHGNGLSISIGNFGNGDDDETTSATHRYIPDFSFSDIGGIDDIIEIVREVIELPIKKPDLFEHLGIKPHKGILLHGFPGCGKTLIAKAVANEIKAHFISIKGPELINKFHGQSEENLRNVFEEARELQPSIIYFDEIDSIAQARSGEETLRFDAKFVNQLLTLMDGIEDYGNVCVIASTNRPELIDNALLRPGRFDYSLEVKKPSEKGCIKIFSIHTKNMPVDKSMDKKEFGKRLIGLSGAEIAFVAREGAYNCLRKNLNMNEIFDKVDSSPVDYESFIIFEKDFYDALQTLNGVDK